MPRKVRPKKDAAACSNPGNSESTPPHGDLEAPSSLSDEEKKLWLQNTSRPEVQFSLEWHKDLDFALRHEDSIRMESELEQEFENTAREVESETWLGRILRQAATACPPSRADDFEVRFPATKESFEAMDLKTPFEAMLATQVIAFNAHALNSLRTAGSSKDPHIQQLYYNLALKLSSAQVRLSDALHRLKNKGQQRVTVEHVQIQDGATKAEGRRVTVSRTETAEEAR